MVISLLNGISPTLSLYQTKTNQIRLITAPTTSCICKIMERMVNSRLTWHLEKNKIITPMQSGFRKGRSTNDQLVRLGTFIRETFASRQHAVAISFDFEKAHDRPTTWKHGINQDLHAAGLRGRLPVFIENFLRDRKFKFRLGCEYSDSFDQEMGVPQCSLLSVTLFALKIKSIVVVVVVKFFNKTLSNAK